MQVSKISVENYQPKTRILRTSAMKDNSIDLSKPLQADELSFKSKKVKTATGVLGALAGGAIGFLLGGPLGAMGGALLGGGGGYAMENEDGKGSTGDDNFYDRRD